MEAVGGASAVAGLVILGAKLTIQVQSFLGRVKNASEDVTRIASDIESLVSVLGRLEGALKDPARRNVFNAMNGSNDFDRVTDDLMAVFKRFEVLMKKFQRIQQSNVQRLKWGWGGEAEALVLGRTLVTHKQTLLLTMQLTNTLAVSSIGGGIDDRLKQTEGNTEQILLKMRELSRASTPNTTEPDKSIAVRQWLQKVTSYAGSTTEADDDTEELAEDFAANIKLSRLRLPTRPGPKPHEEHVPELRLPADDDTAASRDTVALPPQHKLAKKERMSSMASEAMESPNLTKARSSSDLSEVADIVYKSLSPAGPRDISERKQAQSRKHKGSKNVNRYGIVAMFEQAALYKEQGKDKEEDEMYIQAGQHFNRSPDLEDDDYLDQMHDLGVRFKDRRRFDQAEEMLSRVLAAYEKRRGMHHKDTLVVVSNLASTYQRHGQNSKAEEFRKRAIGGFEEILGPEYHRVLHSVLELGRIYISQKRLDEAEDLITRALAGFKKTCGPKHFETGRAIFELGRIYKKQDRIEDFEELYKHALEAFETPAAQDHRRALDLMYELGLFYEGQRRLEEAEDMIKRASRGYEKKCGYKNKTTAMSIWKLAFLYRRRKKYSEAEELYKRALVAFEDSLGPKHITTLRHMIKFAVFYKARERMEEAMEFFERALPEYDALFGPQDNIFRQAAVYLGRLYRKQGKASKAEEIFKRAMATECKFPRPVCLDITKPEEDARSEVFSISADTIRDRDTSSESNSESEQRVKTKKSPRNKPYLPTLTSSSLATFAAQSHSLRVSERSEQASAIREGKRPEKSSRGIKRPQSESLQREKREESVRSKKSNITEAASTAKGGISNDSVLNKSEVSLSS